MFGDSILAHLEPPLNVLNAGIRGYRAEHIYWRVRDTSLPPAVVSTIILGGSNNISRWSIPRPKEIVDTIIPASLNVPNRVKVIVEGGQLKFCIPIRGPHSEGVLETEFLESQVFR